MRVSFCAENEGSSKVREMLQNSNTNIEVTVNKCIGACDKCFGYFIARVDGKLIEADTAEELYEKIMGLSH